MDRDDDLARAIRQRDLSSIVTLLFDPSTGTVRSGFKCEGELWDYKVDCPRLGGRSPEDENAWAEMAADALAFHNTKGGVLVYGITDNFSFEGASTVLDSKQVNDRTRKYLPDTIWIEYQREHIQPDQRYLGVAVVPPRGARIARFQTDAPSIGGKRKFEARGSAIREGDSTRILGPDDADQVSRQTAPPSLGQVYAVDESFFRILAPDFEEFVARLAPCREIETALGDQRAAVTSILGIGGVGKTALATWAAIRAYERGDFDFIVSITAKDRELTSSGIRAMPPALTSFESLLDSVLEVLGFPEVRAALATEEKEKEVRQLIQGSNGLLYVDNLETVDDKRIIQFLDNLPVGVRALTTSRRATVRVSLHPVDLGPLTDEEVPAYIDSLASQPGLDYATRLSRSESQRIGNGCDGIPLAIRWALTRARSSSQAIEAAERISATGRHGEELLEFCFRRVFDTLTETERTVLQTLALFQRPITMEAILAGSEIPEYRLMDTVDSLTSEALVVRLFDSDQNDYAFTLLPMTRAFVYDEVCKQPTLERSIRRRLSDWYEATDVRDQSERLIVRELRQGKGATESALLDLATAAQRRGDIFSAQDLYEQALKRNPTSWKAARQYAEFNRHQLDDTSKALRLYEQAAANAPRRGPDRALIYREWGILLRKSGDPNATDLAIEKLEIAVSEAPNDVVAIHALAHMLHRKGANHRVIELLGPLGSHSSRATREKTYPLLADAYRSVGETLKALETGEKARRLSEER